MTSMTSTTTEKNLTLLTAIIDAVPTAIIMVNSEGKIELVNTQAKRLFGYSGAELLGEMIDILVPFRFRGKHPDLRASFIKAPNSRPMGEGRDLFGLHKNGTEFPIEIGLSPINTEDGLFVISAIVDISERKKLEARFRATVDSAPTAMVMIDQTGTIVLVNAELERLFDYNREELLRKKIEVLIPTRLRSAHPGLRTQYFAMPSSRRMGAGRDLFGLRKDGSEFLIEIGLNPVKTDEGIFVLAAIVDITERTRLADEALRRANEALERSNIELQRFAFVASHDLQTPMRSIASFMELLQLNYKDKLDTQGQDWIRRSVESIKQLQTLISDLLEYSRIDSRASPYESVPFREVYDHALELLDVSVRESGAEVTCGDLPVVTGDRSLLVHLMLNLLGNALKYRSAESPRIHVAAEPQPEGGWLFSVHDNGIGIEPRHHDRIFEIFKRLHGQKEIPGTGIGLAICRRVVHRHGGRIWVESDANQGSVFYFTLTATR